MTSTEAERVLRYNVFNYQITSCLDIQLFEVYYDNLMFYFCLLYLKFHPNINEFYQLVVNMTVSIKMMVFIQLFKFSLY